MAVKVAVGEKVSVAVGSVADNVRDGRVEEKVSVALRNVNVSVRDAMVLHNKKKYPKKRDVISFVRIEFAT